MSNKKEFKKSYRDLVTDLKIMSMRAEYNGERMKAKRYKETYKKLEVARERRHLTPIGEKGREKEAFEKILTMIGERYVEESDEIIEFTIDGINTICEQYRN